ncbi:sulfotransferase [Candidatus Cyanaurora vandensis]|uniref:sulfotransferase family protein n=1 Tax=Candidatus Cyanaurora vandensis TaxID=2714958 RepID=UPI00257FB978|nr:sulfotransferase [Candidatus Cyanaurora vandensis]
MSHIFIVGMPRSGTTLMNSILTAHPEVVIGPETHFLDRWMLRYPQLNMSRPADFRVFWQTFKDTVEFGQLGIEADRALVRLETMGTLSYQKIFTGVMEEYLALVQKPRWGEKTPDHYRHLGTLLAWYPTARVLWMLRDPRAVVASLAKMSWSGEKPAVVHAQKWRESMDLLKQWGGDERVRLVRYEDLVTNPEGEVQSICSFLDLAFIPAMIEAKQSWGDKRYNTKSAALKPISQDSLQKWRKELTSNQVAAVEHITRLEMVEYGYTPDTERMSPFQFAELQLVKNLYKVKRQVQLRTRRINNLSKAQPVS